MNEMSNKTTDTEIEREWMSEQTESASNNWMNVNSIIKH